MCLHVHESVKERERERYIEKKRDRETLHVKALHFDLRHSGWRWPIDSKFPTHNHFKIQLCVNTARMMASHGIWCFLCICSKAPQHYGSLCIAKALQCALIVCQHSKNYGFSSPLLTCSSLSLAMLGCLKQALTQQIFQAQQRQENINPPSSK